MAALMKESVEHRLLEGNLKSAKVLGNVLHPLLAVRYSHLEKLQRYDQLWIA